MCKCLDSCCVLRTDLDGPELYFSARDTEDLAFLERKFHAMISLANPTTPIASPKQSYSTRAKIASLLPQRH